MTKNNTLLAELNAARKLPAPSVRRALRMRAGLSLARVGNALGVSDQAVAYWEAGIRRPRPANLVAYAELLQALRSMLSEDIAPTNSAPAGNQGAEEASRVGGEAPV